MVGRSVKLRAVLHARVEHVQKVRVEEPPPMVFAFRPGVWEEDVDDVCAGWRQEPLHGVVRLDSQQPDIAQSPPTHLLVDLSDAQQQAFNPQVVDLGMLGGASQKEPPLAAADVQRQRTRGIIKAGVKLDTLRPTLRPYDPGVFAGVWHGPLNPQCSVFG